jgi:co-chaperonin GroES (HSP10)
MASNAVLGKAEMDQAFPKADPGVVPYGSRVLVQIRTPKTKVGSIILTDNARDTEKWNTQIAKVISKGPLAFKNRNTLQDWAEGAWCDEGEFVRVPKYGGDRWEVEIEGQPDQPAMFVIFNDLDIIGKVTGDPLGVKAFV